MLFQKLVTILRANEIDRVRVTNLVKVLAAIIGVTDIDKYVSKHSYVKQVVHDDLSAVEEVS